MPKLVRVIKSTRSVNLLYSLFQFCVTRVTNTAPIRYVYTEVLHNLKAIFRVTFPLMLALGSNGEVRARLV